MLNISKEAVTNSTTLLALKQPADGRVVYPVMQFDGIKPPRGVDRVMEALRDVVTTPWTIAAFLTAPQADLDGRTPVEALRDGDIERVATIARQAARSVAA